MKIKLAIDTPSTAYVRIRSKSRVKKTKLLTESAYREESRLIHPVTFEAKNVSSEKGKVKTHRQRSCSKILCEHKKMRSK
jgi:hypothetical protein